MLRAVLGERAAAEQRQPREGQQEKPSHSRGVIGHQSTSTILTTDISASTLSTATTDAGTCDIHGNDERPGTPSREGPPPSLSNAASFSSSSVEKQTPAEEQDDDDEQEEQPQKQLNKEEEPSRKDGRKQPPKQRKKKEEVCIDPSGRGAVIEFTIPKGTDTDTEERGGSAQQVQSQPHLPQHALMLAWFASRRSKLNRVKCASFTPRGHGNGPVDVDDLDDDVARRRRGPGPVDIDTVHEPVDLDADEEWQQNSGAAGDDTGTGSSPLESAPTLAQAGTATTTSFTLPPFRTPSTNCWWWNKGAQDESTASRAATRRAAPAKPVDTDSNTSDEEGTRTASTDNRDRPHSPGEWMWSAGASAAGSAAGADDAATCLSGISVSASDDTPMISNIRHKRKPSSVGELSTVGAGSCGLKGIEERSLSGTGEGSSANSESSSSSPQKSFCQGFLDVETFQGKAVIVLFIVLLLAVATMLISGILGRQPRVGNDTVATKGDGGRDRVFPPTPTGSPTTSRVPPSREPTAVDSSTSDTTTVRDGVSWAIPDTNSSFSVKSNHSSAPSVGTSLRASSSSPPSYLASSRPSVSPTTVLPTTPPSSLLPTNTAPSGANSTSSHYATSFPTLSPSTDVPNWVASTMTPSSGIPRRSRVPFSRTQLTFAGSVQGTASSDAFGQALGLSANGQVMVVGAPNAAVPTNDGTAFMSRAGRVQVFQRTEVTNGDEADEGGAESGWVERGRVLTGASAQNAFGSAVALSYDGTVLACSEPNFDTGTARAGLVRTYRWNAESHAYESLSDLTGITPIAYFGVALALSATGTRLAVGAPFSTVGNTLGFRLQGQVQVYEWNDESKTWVLMGRAINGMGNLDLLGMAVDLSLNGNFLVASAPRNINEMGYVRAWEWEPDSRDWVQLGQGYMINDLWPARSTDRFGHSVSISPVVQDNRTLVRVAVGIPWKNVNSLRNSGMAVVYQLDPLDTDGGAGPVWTALGAPITMDDPTQDDEVGNSVHLVRGDTLAVGVPGADGGVGQVRLYRYHEPSSAGSTSTAASPYWENHPTPLTGLVAGDDFGVAVAMAQPQPNQLSVAVGAVTTSRSVPGYVRTFQQR